jgi:hypothetical protein
MNRLDESPALKILMERTKTGTHVFVCTCFLVYLPVYFLQLLQLIHHAAQHIEPALPEFRRADVDAGIG